MMSGSASVVCTRSARSTADPIALQFKTRPQVLEDSVEQEPEEVYLQYLCPPEGKRDTVMIVVEEVAVLYCLLRALHMGPEEARAAMGAYSIAPGSLTFVNIR